MPLCERGTSPIQAVPVAFLSSPRYANRNTRRGYTGNSADWRPATDSDNSAVARHAISAVRRAFRFIDARLCGHADRVDLRALIVEAPNPVSVLLTNMPGCGMAVRQGHEMMAAMVTVRPADDLAEVARSPWRRAAARAARQATRRRRPHRR
jgi:hypothetical protein